MGFIFLAGISPNTIIKSTITFPPSVLAAIPGRSLQHLLPIAVPTRSYPELTADAASSPLNIQPFTAGYRFGHLVIAHNGNSSLAAESLVPDVDVVIPVSYSGFFAALGYAKRSEVKFQQELIRLHYVTRTFIQPSQELRDLAVKLKLAPVQGILKDKIIMVMDDSIVRGMTSSKIVRLIKNARTKAVHMRIACPPSFGSCYCGVDTRRTEELIANRMDMEGLSMEIGCDLLAFSPLERVRRLLREEALTFCDVCFSRNYPVPQIENEVERAAVD